MESYRERNYNKAIKEYSKAFFSLFEIEYYRFIKMPFSGSKKMFEDSLSQKNIDSFIEHFENLYKENVFVSDLNDVASDNILDEYIDYINSIQTRAVLIDFQKSLEILKPYIDTLSKKKIDYHIPESFKTIKIYADDLFNVLNDDEDFIRTVMNTSKLSNTIKDKYYSYDFVDAIDGIWEFERGQRENYGSDAFLFLKKYKEYYMSKYDLALICITFKNLELNVNYISNRTYLNNRSDGQKKNTHSIKRSYGTKKQGNFDASLSTLRDGIFRIICRMTYLKVSNGNYNEFIYYEYPMNLLNNKYMLVIEKYKSLKLKTSIYQVLAETMNDY